MTGSDFNRLPDGGGFIIGYTLLVLFLWEAGRAIWPHIHLYWK